MTSHFNHFLLVLYACFRLPTYSMLFATFKYQHNCQNILKYITLYFNYIQHISYLCSFSCTFPIFMPISCNVIGLIVSCRIGSFSSCTFPILIPISCKVIRFIVSCRLDDRLTSVDQTSMFLEFIIALTSLYSLHKRLSLLLYKTWNILPL